MAEGAIRNGIEALNEGQSGLHLKRLKDARAEEIGIGVAGDFGDDQAENDVSGVAIGPACARGEFGPALAGEQVQHFLVLNLAVGGPDGSLALFHFVHQVFIVGESGGVGEQMADGDGLAVGGEGGEDFGQGLVIAQLAIVHQEHDCHGGELLGERGKTEVSGRVDCRERLEVARTIAAFEDRAPVLPDEDCKAWCGLGSERRKNGIERVAGGEGSQG